MANVVTMSGGKTSIGKEIEEAKRVLLCYLSAFDNSIKGDYDREVPNCRLSLCCQILDNL